MRETFGRFQARNGPGTEINASNQEQLQADLRWASNPNKSLAFGKEPGIRPALKEVHKWLERALVRSYEKAMSEAGDAFTHRNWFRSKKTLGEIHRQLDQIVQDREGLSPPRLRAAKNTIPLNEYLALPSGG